MSYLIKWKSQGLESIPGKTNIVLADKTSDNTATSIVLTGKGLYNYGLFQQENFLQILENFASATPPANPTIGQQWYDTANKVTKVYTQIGTTQNGTWESFNQQSGNFAPLASPAFTGTPTAPTASAATNTTQLATTAHVKLVAASYALLASSPVFTGSVSAPTFVSTIGSAFYDVSGVAGSGSSIPAGLAVHDCFSWANKADNAATAITFAAGGSRILQMQSTITGEIFTRGLHTSTNNTVWRRSWDSVNTIELGNTPATARAALELVTVASSGSASDLTTGTLSASRLPFSYSVPATAGNIAQRDGNGALVASAYFGSGENLTAINASNLGSGTVPAARLSGTYNITNSGSSATLTTGRTIGMTGDVTWTSGSFNGSANVTGTATLADSGVAAGTYNNVATQVRPFTVDTKGRLTNIGAAVTIAPAFSSVTGKPTTFSGYGIIDTINNLSNVTITSPASGEVFGYNGSAWVNRTLAEAGIAPLASPAFTGTPTAPTAAGGTNNTQLATTAFVQSVVSSGLAGKVDLAAIGTTVAPLASPAFTGTPTGPTAGGATNNTQLATTAFVQGVVSSGLAGKIDLAAIGTTVAPLASPAFTGTPTTTAPGLADSSTRIATTAFVKNVFSSATFLSLNNTTMAAPAGISWSGTVNRSTYTSSYNIVVVEGGASLAGATGTLGTLPASFRPTQGTVRVAASWCSAAGAAAEGVLLLVNTDGQISFFSENKTSGTLYYNFCYYAILS